MKQTIIEKILSISYGITTVTQIMMTSLAPSSHGESSLGARDVNNIWSARLCPDHAHIGVKYFPDKDQGEIISTLVCPELYLA